jgi:hypothetical protein
VSFGGATGEEPLPVGSSREKIAVPPHRSGLDRVALGLRHGRHHLRKAPSIASLTSARRSGGTLSGIAKQQEREGENQ